MDEARVSAAIHEVQRGAGARLRGCAGAARGRRGGGAGARRREAAGCRNGGDTAPARPLQVLGGGDETILEYLAGVLCDEHFPWGEAFDHVGGIMVRGTARMGAAWARMAGPHGGAAWRRGVAARRGMLRSVRRGTREARPLTRSRVRR
jgi:hypothetical protein